MLQVYQSINTYDTAVGQLMRVADVEELTVVVHISIVTITGAVKGRPDGVNQELDTVRQLVSSSADL